MVVLTDMSDLDAAARSEIEAALAGLGTLAEVIRWGLAQAPELVIDDVIVQDEYCHDVIMPWRAGRFLVFDTT